MDDVLDRLRRRQDEIVASSCVSADAIYHRMRAAFGVPDAQFLLAETLDFGPLPAPKSFHPTEGEHPPPPRSGGGVYHALFWIYEYCVKYPLVMAELEAERVASGDIEEAYSLIGTVEVAHATMRACWYDASAYIARWVQELQHAAFEESEVAAENWLRELGSELEPQPAKLTGEAREQRLRAWQNVLALAGMADQRANTWLADASLQVQAAAQFYVGCLERICASQAAPPLDATVRDVQRLEVAGNRLCASSATLLTPAYHALYEHLIHLHTLRSEDER